jgi:DNA-directed RNA polymerase specialized sigma24 family protein
MKTSNTALKLVTSSTETGASRDLDALVRDAFAGDRSALDTIARELHPRLVREARIALGNFEYEAEDVVQDLYVAILEGRVRAPRGRGEALARLQRLVGLFARKHAREVRRFRRLE